MSELKFQYIFVKFSFSFLQSKKTKTYERSNLSFCFRTFVRLYPSLQVESFDCSVFGRKCLRWLITWIYNWQQGRKKSTYLETKRPHLLRCWTYSSWLPNTREILRHKQGSLSIQEYEEGGVIWQQKSRINWPRVETGPRRWSIKSNRT